MSSKPTSSSYLLSLTLPYVVPLRLWGPECYHPIWLEPLMSLFSPVLCRALRAIQIVCQAYQLCLNNIFFKTPHSHCLTFNLVSYLNKHIISYPVSCFLALPFYTMLSDCPAESKRFLKGSIWSSLQSIPNLSNLVSCCQSLSCATYGPAELYLHNSITNTLIPSLSPEVLAKKLVSYLPKKQFQPYFKIQITLWLL